jgi:hypothetical protein
VIKFLDVQLFVDGELHTSGRNMHALRLDPHRDLLADSTSVSSQCFRITPAGEAILLSKGCFTPMTSKV